MWKHREQATLALATFLTAAGLAAVPSWHDALFEVCHQAAIAGAVTIAVLWVALLLGARGLLVERVWSALFLAGMPVVYVVAWLAAGGDRGGVPLAIEVVGIPIYAGLALLGLNRSPWFLVAGIAAHGVFWDAWHYLVGSAYIPTWYVSACLLADVGISLYLATRVPAWRSGTPAARPDFST